MSERTLYSTSLSSLVDTLAYLASMTIQDRYIVNGTQDSYLTPDDLLNDFDSDLIFFRFERFPERMRKLEESMGSLAYKRLLELEMLIKENPSFLDNYTFANIRTLIHDDPLWAEIRNIASQILRTMNFDLQLWEKENA